MFSLTAGHGRPYGQHQILYTVRTKNALQGHPIRHSAPQIKSKPAKGESPEQETNLIARSYIFGQFSFVGIKWQRHISCIEGKNPSTTVFSLLCFALTNSRNRYLSQGREWMSGFAVQILCQSSEMPCT